MNKGLTVLRNNIWIDNPVFVQILGICSTLAVTNNIRNTFIMTVALAFVTSMSNLVISLTKTMIPKNVRMIIQTLVIAFFVIIVDLVLKAYIPDVSKALGTYVGLIISNCIVMGRAEAFAQSNPPLLSFWDGLISGIGYMLVLLPISIVREIMGFGTFYGIHVTPKFFTPWTLMIMAPSGFFMIAIYIWIAKSVQLNKKGDKNDQCSGY